MLSSAIGSKDTSLIERTIGQVFDATCDAYPEVPALVSRHQGVRLTYRDLRDRVDSLAIGFHALGLKKGDRVGIWAPNREEWVLTQFATAKLGLILVNVNPAYRTSELEYAVNLVGMRAIVIASTFKSSDYVDMIRNLVKRNRLPTLKEIIVLDGGGGPGMLNFADVVSTPTPSEQGMLAKINEQLDASDPINIQFTSGTTGAPKGATLTHRNILNNGHFVVDALGIGVGEAICIPVPLYHCFGMVMGNLGLVTHGGTMVFPAEAFDPAATLAAIEEVGCAGIYAVPTMFIAMLDELDQKDYNLSALRTGIMAGSPCPIEVMRRVMNEMNCAEISIAYGMTETSPVSFQSSRDDTIERRVTTVGRIQPRAEAKIIAPDTGRILPRGEMGELCTRGYLVMQGYWNDPKKTAEAIDEDGFMHTGDLAVMDESGYVNIAGRSKDMVIRGGENIYPREVEEFLYQHPGVSDVQVIGVPDAKYGEVLCAVVIRANSELEPDHLRDFCKDQIAHFKIPTYVEFVESFPMTVTGKVQKYVLRQKISEKLGLVDEKTA
ncbi:MAG: AMP-binding protein [Pseudomonadota bacterium]